MRTKTLVHSAANHGCFTECIHLFRSLQWRRDKRDGVSNHRRLDCLPNRLSACRSKKISKLRFTGICEGKSPVTGEFPSQRACKRENVSIWWRHHVSWKPGCDADHWLFDYSVWSLNNHCAKHVYKHKGHFKTMYRNYQLEYSNITSTK